METQTKKLYKKSGFVQQSVNAIVQLIVGVGVAVMVLIFIGALGGQTYNLVESDINGIGNTSEIAKSWVAINNTAVSIGNSNIHQGSLTITNNSNSFGLVIVGSLKTISFVSNLVISKVNSVLSFARLL